MDYLNAKKDMMKISNYAGDRLDYVQGGGGNTSVKFDENFMAIKASGYTLKEVQEDKGYVLVDYQNIKNRYEDMTTKSNVDVEKESLAVNLDSVKLLEGMEKRRPSVEVGFHSFLPRCVVHTHSVYSNILCCSEEGEEKAEEIFKDSDLGYIFIPYINPGFALAFRIKEGVEKHEKQNGKQPDIIFMKNHGMITFSDDADTAVEIHEKANNLIGEFFKTPDFPVPEIERSEDGFVSRTDYIRDFIMNHHASEEYFDEKILYPDQLVYLGENLGKGILIDEKNGEIKYRIEGKQAQTVEETILGVAYIIDEIENAGLTLSTLCEEGVDFIRNWESEKYRASIVSKQTNK